MKDLKTLYKHLMQMYQIEREYWHDLYVEIAEKIESLRKELNNQAHFKVNEASIYNSENNYSSWEEFLSCLFANKGNGIASNGQSIFSNEMREIAVNNEEFIELLTKLLKDPNKYNHDKFAELWYRLFSKNNPVQTNRASAAFTLDLSSTVDEGKFNSIFRWFIDNKYVDEYNGDHNWYDKNKFLIEQLRTILMSDNDEFLSELKAANIKIDKYWISIFIWMAFENINNSFQLNKQLIKYGAPGTGKTYLSKQLCDIQFDLWKNSYGVTSNLSISDVLDIVQFHPTYSYEDFVEGLRPISSNGNVQLELKNGVFKQICKKAGKWEHDLYLVDPSRDLESWKVVEIIQSDNEIFRQERWSFMNNIDERIKIDDDLNIEDVLPPHFLIIDEINRAELSAVFGELMYCLEYRGISNAIKTQYSELNNNCTALINIKGEYKFYVPHNLYLLGTMNTIDRSVDVFDFALRRRFRWEEVEPNMDVLRLNISTINAKWLGIVDSVRRLNDKIRNEELLGKDYQLGHAYFMNLKYSTDLNISTLKKYIWRDRVGSLIEEYLRGTGKQDIIKSYKDEFFK